MKKDVTIRGFDIWRIENAQYPSEPVQVLEVQESSLATEVYVWVGYSGERGLHLSASAARELRDALSEWLTKVSAEDQ